MVSFARRHVALRSLSGGFESSNFALVRKLLFMAFAGCLLLVYAPQTLKTTTATTEQQELSGQKQLQVSTMSHTGLHLEAAHQPETTLSTPELPETPVVIPQIQQEQQIEKLEPTAQVEEPEPQPVPVDPTQIPNNQQQEDPVDIIPEPRATTPAQICTPEKAQERGQTLRTFISSMPKSFECPSHVWMDAFEELEGQKPRFFVNVGANKGYNFVDWLNRFCPEIQVDNQQWGHALRELNVTDCGACGDCNIPRKPSKAPSRPVGTDCPVEVLAYEPGTTFPVLQKTVHKMLRHPNSRAKLLFKLDLKRRAFSNETGVARFPKCGLGDETCFIGGNVTSYDNVGQVTLDSELLPLNRVIDALLIDTEGFDPLVLDGGQILLSNNQRVRVLVFENHGVNHWSYAKLKTYVDRLDTAGYDCFYDYSSLFKMTNCWSEDFEIRQWSNVVCISRQETRLLEHLTSAGVIY